MAQEDLKLNCFQITHVALWVLSLLLMLLCPHLAPSPHVDSSALDAESVIVMYHFQSCWFCVPSAQCPNPLARNDLCCFLSKNYVPDMIFASSWKSPGISLMLIRKQTKQNKAKTCGAYRCDLVTFQLCWTLGCHWESKSTAPEGFAKWVFVV